MRKRIIVIAFAVMIVSACTSRYASNGEHLYLRSDNGPNLIIPGPLTAVNINHFYDLPSASGPKDVSIEPPISD